MASDQPLGTVTDPAGAPGRPPEAPSYLPAKVPSRPAVVALVGGVLLAAVLLAAAGALSIFLVGLALAYVIDPAATALARHEAPRWLASLALIVLLMVSLLAFTVILASSVVSQGAAFVATAPVALADLRTWLDEAPLSPQIHDALVSYVSGLGATLGSVDLLAVLPGVAASLFSVFDVTIAAIGLPFYVFLVVVDRPGLAAEVRRRLPDAWRADILAVSGIVARQFGNYIRSEAILMVLLGLLTWAGLMLLAMTVDPRIGDYAVFLAVVAAFSELIPLFGPWIAMIPAVVFGLTLGPVPLIAIGLLYVVVCLHRRQCPGPGDRGPVVRPPAGHRRARHHDRPDARRGLRRRPGRAYRIGGARRLRVPLPTGRGHATRNGPGGSRTATSRP